MSSDVTRLGDTARVRPDAILPQHAAYDAARAAWNLAVDQRPAAIVVARTAADAVGAIELAAEHDLRVVPQGTGHLAAALPDLDEAILVRTAIGGVEVDPVARTARVGAGTVWRDVVEAVHPHGLAALSGSSHDVGVLGYTLGGGMSWLARSAGLSCNRVRAIELVTADGRLVRADAEHEPELFWALRGGGGNFGLVTHVELELLPVTEVFAGMTVWPVAQVREVLDAWRAWCAGAPEEATTAFRVLRLPPLPEVPEPLRDVPLVVVDGAVRADAAQAARMLAGFRSAGAAAIDTWAPMAPRQLIEIHMDPPQPVPAQGDTALLGELDADAVAAFLAAVEPEEVAPLLFAELRQLGGALARVPEGAGARGSLEGSFALFGVGMPQSPEHADALDARLARLVGAMAPWSTGTRYLNFAERGGDAADGFAPGVYARLQAVRRSWDPTERLLASHRIAAA